MIISDDRITYRRTSWRRRIEERSWRRSRDDASGIFAVEEQPGQAIFALAVCVVAAVLVYRRLDDQTQWLDGSSLLVQPPLLAKPVPCRVLDFCFVSPAKLNGSSDPVGQIWIFSVD